jgi:hypothetical protein
MTIDEARRRLERVSRRLREEVAVLTWPDDADAIDTILTALDYTVEDIWRHGVAGMQTEHGTSDFPSLDEFRAFLFTETSERIAATRVPAPSPGDDRAS